MFDVDLGEVAAPAHPKTKICGRIKVSIITWEFLFVDVVVDRVAGWLAQIEDEST